MSRITFIYGFLIQVAGQYLPQYEVYYKRLDPEGSGKIAAMDAATFLKKSQLPDELLGKVSLHSIDLRTHRSEFFYMLFFSRKAGQEKL